MSLPPLPRLFNLGNSCWCAAAVQALRAVGVVFHRQFKDNTLLARALRADRLSDTELRRLYTQSRKIIKAAATTPEDPAEFLVALFDTDGVSCKAFESERTIVKCCDACGFVRTERLKECMMIIPRISNGVSPLQRALDTEFGFHVSSPHISEEAVGACSAEEARDFVPALGGIPGEEWWLCDDEHIKKVSLTSAAPYLVFYVERASGTRNMEVDREDTFADPEELDEETISMLLPTVSQTQELDCEGKCKGKKTKHSVFVGSYEASDVLIVHVQCPKLMPLNHVERTLFASEEKVNDNQVPFDLVAMVCRVGTCHYVCYRRIF